MKGSPRSLSFLMTAWTAIAIALAMGLYGTYQYLTLPDTSLATIAVNHLLHVVVLVSLVYGLTWIAFRKAVLLPLKEVYRHLYGIGAGRLRPLQVQSKVLEVQSIVEGVNLMVRRMEQGFDGETIERFQENIDSLRGVARSIAKDSPEQAATILDDIAVLETAFMSVVRSGTKTPVCL